MKKFLCLFFILISYVYGTPLDVDAVVVCEKFPRINGVVDPISGALVYDRHDLIINGKEPIYVRGGYISDADTLSYDGGWLFFPASSITKKDKDYYVRETSGANVKYRNAKIGLLHDNYGYRIDYNVHKLRFTNDRWEELSGRTNPINKVLVTDKGKKILSAGDGSKKIYDQKYKKDKLLHSKEAKYYLEKEIKPNGNIIFYDYDQHDRVKTVRTTNPSEDKEYSRLDIEYLSDKKSKNHDFKITTSNGYEASYFYWRPEEQYVHDFFYLKKIEGNVLPETIKYADGYEKRFNRNRAPFVSNIIQPNDSLQIEYYFHKDKAFNSDFNMIDLRRAYKVCDRVKFLYSPVGENEEMVPTYKFEYLLPKYRVKVGGYLYFEENIPTLVKDMIYGDKTTYYSSNEMRLTKINYAYTSRNKEYLFDEEYFWDEERKSFLKLKIYKDHRDEGLFVGHQYIYDDRGNVLHESFCGNLTGRANNKFEIKGKDIINTEKYNKYYEYSDDGFNLPLKKEEANGLVAKYTYKPKTDLVTSKLVIQMGKALQEQFSQGKFSQGKFAKKRKKDKKKKEKANPSDTQVSYNNFKQRDSSQDKILQRHFFKYNEDNILVEEISDDGDAASANDLSSVTIRKIKKIKPKQANPAINLPEEISNFYWDKKADEEVFISKKVLYYNKQNKVVQEDTYGIDGFCYSIYNRYDEKGLLTEHTDSLGRTSNYEYNASQKLISLKKGDDNIKYKFNYDQAGRLIKKEEHSSLGERTYLYTYDGKHNKTGETDHNGHTFKYEYNGRGYLLQKTLPQVIDEDRTLDITTQYEYDGFGKEITSIDPDGNITRKQYNAYGDVTKIIYPDKSEAFFSYNLDGSLKEHIDQEGNKTCFTYDVLGRELTKKICSSSKELVSTEEKKYNGFEIVSYKNPDGNKTYYYYDGAGRKIAQEFHHNQKIEREEYTYDHLGRLHQTTICNDDNTLISIEEKDIANRVIEKRKEELNGNILTQVFYEYDDCNNKVLEKAFVDGKESITAYQYDDYNRLIKETNAQGYEHLTVYDDGYINKHDQKVLKKTQIDPLGIQTIEIFDVLGNSISIEKRNAQDKKLSFEQLFYDKRSNIIKHKSKRIKLKYKKFSMLGRAFVKRS